MRKLLVLLAVAGCAGDDGGPHELGRCDAAAWGNTRAMTCEAACAAAPPSIGPSCVGATCVSGDGRTCLGPMDCPSTITTADGYTGCCSARPVGDGKYYVQFYECP